MLRLIKRPLAEQDLEEIWLYTYGKWGEKQADKYLRELQQVMETILGNPKIGATYDYADIPYRYYSFNHHVIWYRLDGENILVVRILHENMKPERHL